MGIRNDARLARLLAASEARGRGERTSSAPEGAWAKVERKSRSGQESVSVKSNVHIRVLGVDTALRKTGWGVIEINGRTITAVDCGVIVNPPSSSICDCMRSLNSAVMDLLVRYAPDEIAIEGGFYCRNARTAIILGTARGAVLGVLAEAELPVYEYAPRRAKQAVTGRGSATKEQVAAMVSNFLNIQVSNLADDSTDALALAICHAKQRSNPLGEVGNLI